MVEMDKLGEGTGGQGWLPEVMVEEVKREMFGD